MKKAFLTLIAAIVALALVACGTEGPTGPQGERGKPGIDGSDGKSAYELAVEKGYNGTVEEWLASLVGEVGASGSDGMNGESAYEIAVKNGYTGTETEWLASLVGAPGVNGTNGKSAYEVAVKNGYTGTETDWLTSLIGAPGANGTNGKSAYELACENGYKGSLSAWLDSLVGEDGTNGTNGIDGTNGKSAYELACENGFNGSLTEWLASLVGKDGDSVKGDKGDEGKSAYELACENGYEGSIQDWLNSLVGEKGETGDTGADGKTPYVQDGYWWIGDTNTSVKAEGVDGENGVGIADIIIDYKGYVVITLTDGRVVEIKVEESCEHTTFTDYYTSPTCNEKGYTTYTCTECGMKYLDGFVNESGHHFVDSFCAICGKAEPVGGINVDTSWYVSSESEFTLKSREELAGLSHLVNTGTTFSEKTVSLGADIDLDCAEWIPIGTADHPFAGTFDGYNFNICNLKITSQQSYVGLFGYSEGVIKRVTVTGANVSVAKNGAYVAICCGYTSNELEGVTVSGYVNAPMSDYVGGVAGYVSLKGIDRICDCTSSADIVGNNYVGGILGYAYDSQSTTGTPTHQITSAENSGDIVGKDYVGGIVGYLYTCNSYSYSHNKMTATYLNNSGSVTGVQYVGGSIGYAFCPGESTLQYGINSSLVSGSVYVGGIIGYSDSLVLLDCDNTDSGITASGYVVEEGQYKVYLGGYAGFGYVIKNCDNNVVITYTGKGDYVGGIAGYLCGAVSDCGNTATIDATKSSYVGGIAGHIGLSGNTSIFDCTNTAAVTGKDYVGGIVGGLNGIANEYINYTLEISMMDNSGDIAGADYIGGIFGYLYADNACYDIYSGNYIFKIIITDFTNEGDVSGDEYVGGNVGYAYADGKSTFENGTNSSSVSGSVYVGGIIGYSGNIALIECDNTASSITASGYLTDNGQYKVYLGGYAGYGYSVENCINGVAVTYTSKGDYVGGIGGYLSGYVSGCSNTAAIDAKQSSYVGGVAGYIALKGSAEIFDCTNTAAVTGKNYVGGIVGIISCVADSSSDYTVQMSKLENTGDITAEKYVGGIFGYLYAENVRNDIYSYVVKIVITDFINSGKVTGTETVGGCIGYAYSDGASTTADVLQLGAVCLGEITLDIAFGEIHNFTVA